MISTVGVFTIGSAICGAANDVGVMIAGRAVQGLGSAGINTVMEIIICDLIPLRERGQFIGFLFGAVIMGSVLGPFLGGLLAERDWRWTFYLNLPLGVSSMVVLFFLLNTTQKAVEGSLASKIKKVDFVGLLVLCGSVTAVLYAFVYGGTRFVWTDVHIIASLAVGAAGLVVFLLFESSRFCKEPMLPRVLFANRTSAAGFIGTFIQTLISFWVLYFIPLYFQSTLLVSPSQSGLYILPFSFLYGFSAVIGGGITTKLGKFKVVQVFGFALMVVSLGTFSIWDRNTPTAVWVVTQLMCALSMGVVTPSLLTAIQADLPPTLNAPSTAAFGFIRSIGTIFGVSIPAAIFNNRFDELLTALGNEEVTTLLERGRAYEQASKALIESFADPAVRDAVVGLYERSLQRIWQVAIGVAGIGFLAVLMEKDLRTSQEPQGEAVEVESQAIPIRAASRASSTASFMASGASRSESRMSSYSIGTTTSVERRWTLWDQELVGWRASRMSWGQLSPFSTAVPMSPGIHPDLGRISRLSGRDWPIINDEPDIVTIQRIYQRHSR